MKQTISVLVENQAGVLNRITGLFSRRALSSGVSKYRPLTR